MIDPSLVERFDTPPSEYGPTPLWWWSGGTVTEEGIDWQLQRFADGGILNLVLMNLAPKGPTYGAPPDDPVWFSERWWDLFRHTCERAAALGIRLWFYDQIGFSGANLQGHLTAQHPDAAGRSLRSHVVEVETGGRLPHVPREHTIAVFEDAPGATTWRRLHVVDGHVATSEAGTRVRVVSWRETSFDYLSAASVALLIDLVHGEYERRVPEHVGTTIVGSFQDELPAMPTWSATFAARFQEETGYDIVPRLPALWEQGSPTNADVRSDYHRVRTLLAEEAFFRPLGEWHRSRGMLLGADQMNPARAGIPTQSTQLYGDYYATHRWFDAVGSDHEGDSRIHSSMADLYDHPRVWIESFHSSGWGGTLEDTWDWLIPFFRSGANLYNPHASYYGLRAGWFEWAPPSTDFRQPYYAVYPQFATAVARVSALMTWGRHAVDVALLYPSTSIARELPPDLPIDHFRDGDVGPEYPGVDETQHAYMALAGKNDWFRARPGLLDQRGIDFDVVDDDSVVRSVVEDGALGINGFSFRTVVLPGTTRLPVAAAERLLELLDRGGRVIAVGAVDAALAGHPRLERVTTPDDAVIVLETTAQFAWSTHGVRAQRHGDHGVALVPGAFPNATAYPLRTGDGAGGWDDIDFDAARYGSHHELRVQGAVAEAELWDPGTGRRTPTDFTISPDGATSTIAVDAGGAPLLIAVWRTDPHHVTDLERADDPQHPTDRSPVTDTTGAAPRERVDARDRTPVTATWTQDLVPTLDNHWGDFALPPGDDPVPLELWEVDLVTDGTRVPVRVTMGQELLVSDPFPTDDAPRPIRPEDAHAVRTDEGAALRTDGWDVQRYSATVGRDGSLGVSQDPKGFIAEDFVTHRTPGPGESVGVRTVVRVPAPGDLDLTISSVCDTRAWFDGVELDLVGAGYDAASTVHFASTVGVLEYWLSAPALVTATGDGPTHLTSAFWFVEPGAGVQRPEFIGAGARGVVDGTATFRRSFQLDVDAASVRVVTGAPSALTVVVDGATVARQEQVEYYESGLGDQPDYFLHDLGPLAAGEHTIEIVTDDVTADTPLFVDLVLTTAGDDGTDHPVGTDQIGTDQRGTGRTVAVPSGAGWTVGPDDVPVQLLPARTGSTVHARAARRPHPLVAAHWLSGPPEVGDPTVPFATSLSTVPRAETFELRVPAGTARVELPLAADADADTDSDITAITATDGTTVELRGAVAVLDPPTTAPTTLTVSLAPRAFDTSGAAWSGPLTVGTVPAPARFEDWSDQALDAWSGAVRYSTTIDLMDPTRLELDLGRVRGAVVVELDGVTVGSAFCAPFVFAIDATAGLHDLDVTVYGTLAPRYAAATQTTFLKPTQLRTGITGKVRLDALTLGTEGRVR